MLLELADAFLIAGDSMASFLEPLGALFIHRKRDEARSPDRLRAHYEVERRLADRVRNAATWEERRALFSTMYDELFREVPDHPRLASRRSDSEFRERAIAWNLAQLKPYLRPGQTFLEV